MVLKLPNTNRLQENKPTGCWGWPRSELSDLSSDGGVGWPGTITSKTERTVKRILGDVYQ